jgi:prepilin-type processing-associated H-X9-DG protein
MPIPLDERKKPTTLKVQVTTGEGVEVTWADGHVSRYTFPYLREHCPCAMCNDERQKKAKMGNTLSVLPMFKPRVTAKSAKPVGNYAVQIDYSDGHATGIYSFGHLREICPCEACQREFAAAVK